ncbi:MAG: tRNA uridine-5-carboxymethylaminomethyl(34) synthesis enzyme MnmG [Candidatus Cloacimonetes bacterium]|nr:tRNA uridine-5-carboxymethylaminomethyl(34) synthesis enzyme MnmG [Candidatus Cloacimonadota bacterium]
MNEYDVIVVGAGHAGVEAALAAARMGARTLLFTIKLEAIGRMSCNPSVGGPAKGHLVREIDALGGEMGRVADLTGIQFRMLNRAKGPAVWAPRAQNDRLFYGVEMRKALEAQDRLDIKESAVDDVLTENGNVRGVRSQLGEDYLAPRVILACGTFLRGTIHVGDVAFAGGRSGEPAACELSTSLEALGLRLVRFKTGTPPRVDLRTVDLSCCEEQPGDPDPQGFSYYRDIKPRNLVSCWLTGTRPETHDIIREALERSALYGGRISGTGPRYCPSIEDKIVKFAARQRHQVFIEPEGTHTHEAYVNGVSNSLPPAVQSAFLATIPGLEQARVMRYGYAIEYDLVEPGQIDLTLQCRAIEGLYIAGQINGTSGYEEAAAQGLVAAVNAVCTLGGQGEIIFDRAHSYIGVLIDDLVTRGASEPYRLFTSRAEYRLFLRQDNADERLMPTGRELGLLSDTRWQAFQRMSHLKRRETQRLQSTNSTPTDDIPEPTRLYKLLKRPNLDISDLPRLGYVLPDDVSQDIWNRLRIEIKYEGYLARQRQDIARFEEMEHRLIPPDVEYMGIETIAWEAREKLQRMQPRSLGQAARIAGVNHTDIVALMVWLKKHAQRV